MDLLSLSLSLSLSASPCSSFLHILRLSNRYLSTVAFLALLPFLTHWFNVRLYFCGWSAWCVSKAQRFKEKVQSNLDWRRSFDSCSKTYFPLRASVDLKTAMFILAKLPLFTNYLATDWKTCNCNAFLLLVLSIKWHFMCCPVNTTCVYVFAHLAKHKIKGALHQFYNLKSVNLGHPMCRGLVIAAVSRGSSPTCGLLLYVTWASSDHLMSGGFGIS